MSSENRHRSGNGAKLEGSGALVVIGGHEDRENDIEILREVARRVGKGRLVVTTVASHEPEGYFEQYKKAFDKIGLADVVELEIRHRSEASDPAKVTLLDGATGIFFTGGDQLKITSQIGDTPISRRIEAIYDSGGVIAGTSAGASAMCETMLVRGTGQESYRIGDLMMAPGLGLLHDAIVDQHFAERGRMGRLLGAVAQNPRILGIGIDEDTAIIMDSANEFHVLGNGAVYVLDGETSPYSNIADSGKNATLSIYDVRLHVLSVGDKFDLRERRPGEFANPDGKEADAPAEKTAANVRENLSKL